jgi:hypothetical protein
MLWRHLSQILAAKSAFISILFALSSPAIAWQEKTSKNCTRECNWACTSLLCPGAKRKVCGEERCSRSSPQGLDPNVKRREEEKRQAADAERRRQEQQGRDQAAERERLRQASEAERRRLEQAQREAELKRQQVDEDRRRQELAQREAELRRQQQAEAERRRQEQARNEADQQRQQQAEADRRRDEQRKTDAERARAAQAQQTQPQQPQQPPQRSAAIATGAAAGTAAAIMASARDMSLWTHNSSQMKVAVDGERVVIAYDKPRSGLGDLGINSGTPLFVGTRSGSSWTGEATTFSSRCGERKFEVSGLQTSDSKRVELRGRRPNLDGNCVASSYRDETLVFDLVKVTSP